MCCTYIHMHMGMDRYTHTHTRTHTRTHTHTHMHTHTCTHTCTHTHTHTHTCTHTPTHAHTHRHTHTCMWKHRVSTTSDIWSRRHQNFQTYGAFVWFEKMGIVFKCSIYHYFLKKWYQCIVWSTHFVPSFVLLYWLCHWQYHTCVLHDLVH